MPYLFLECDMVKSSSEHKMIKVNGMAVDRPLPKRVPNLNQETDVNLTLKALIRTKDQHRLFLRTILLNSFVSFSIVAVCISNVYAFEFKSLLGFAGFSKSESKSPSQKKLIVLGVDGLSFNAYQVARQKGLFTDFKNAGAHVAPFPSMTDLSWSTIMHTPEVFGRAGRIRSVEATHYDEASQSIEGDPRDYFRRLAFPKYYMNAFENFFNPYVEALMYFPTEEVPKLEIRSVIDQILSSKSEDVITGYIGAVDSTAHTQFNRLFPVLVTLDLEIKRMLKTFKDREQEVELIMISDHGNIGRFQEGGMESELIGVDLAPVMGRAGLNYVSEIRNQKDVATPLMALGSWAPVYLKSRNNENALLSALRQEPWFDLAVSIHERRLDSFGDEQFYTMKVVSRDGMGFVQKNIKTNSIYYFVQEGNPLQIADSLISSKSNLVAIDPQTALTATAKSGYPDALYRIAEAGSLEHFDFPNLIITTKDGYFIRGPLGGFTKMYRTHGSLSAASSFGLLASTSRKIPGMVRSKDLLGVLDLKAEELFGSIAKSQKSGQKEILKQALKDPQIETKARDFTQKRIFQYMSRFVADTRSYFLVTEIQSMIQAFKMGISNTGSISLPPSQFELSNFDFQKLITPEEIGSLTDTIVRNPSIEALAQNPTIKKIQQKFPLLQRLSPEVLTTSSAGSGAPLPKNFQLAALAAKRSTMKLYQMPYLLESALNIQEKNELDDPRDTDFAKSWISSQTSNSNDPKTLAKKFSSTQTLAQKLFFEAMQESSLEDKLYPTPIAELYPADLKNTTIVYIPGVYNSIFDKEIFSLGLAAIREELGLRVISPPVESTCSSEFNARIILNYLKEDQRLEKERGNKEPSYLFLGYSKGAVDGLHALVKAPEFASLNIKAFVSIASPLWGSSILNKTDLPFTLVNLLSENQGPKICATEQQASRSVVPTYMARFWRKNERALTGLTRYFSITFKSDPENSHLFMKATKLIAQFDEENDGVVTVSASKFPEAMGAIDLGTLNADHLAGILSSRFPQKAFMKAIIKTLSQLDIENEDQNLKINARQILKLHNKLARVSEKSFSTVKIQNDQAVINSWLLNPLDYLKDKDFRTRYQSSYDLNKALLPEVNDPADNYEPQVSLPSNQLKFEPYNTLDVAKLSDALGAIRVSPTTTHNFPNGIDISVHHQSFVHFRMDHQFNYESRSPGGCDDNTGFGYSIANFNNEPGWALMRSNKNSIRLTTAAYRFNPTEFSHMQLRLAVTKGVKGADPVKGHTGKDDSAFQVWFTIREKVTNGDRSILDMNRDHIFLFGYYWGDPAEGEARKPGDIFENWYSNKNIVVATLPEAKQLLLNDQSMLGKPQNFDRSLAEDLARAFPNRKVSDMEIIAITIQHDSNDTGDSSEAYFKSLKFIP